MEVTQSVLQVFQCLFIQIKVQRITEFQKAGQHGNQVSVFCPLDPNSFQGGSEIVCRRCVICSWDVPGLAATSPETICFNRPGRMIGIQPPGRDGTPPGVLALFASPPLDIGRRDTAQRLAEGWNRADGLFGALDARRLPR